jgi:hypothetical protein
MKQASGPKSVQHGDGIEIDVGNGEYSHERERTMTK